MVQVDPSQIDEDDWDDDWAINAGEYNKLRVWEWNEIVDHPVFMKEIPADISNNDHLLALQSIMYDDETPESLALHFKNLGNEFMVVKPPTSISRRNALLAYTKALESESSDKYVVSQIHSNRAQVALYLKEYAKAVDDCRAAIASDPTNNKAYYRGAKASLEMGLARQAIKLLNKLMEVDPDSTEVKALYAKAEDAQRITSAAREKENANRGKELSQQEIDRKALQDFLLTREVTLYPCLYEISMYQRHGTPEIYPFMAADQNGIPAVQWPILFLTHEYNQSDFVQEFDEDSPLDDFARQMFPEDRHPDWDEEGKYIWNRLEYYVECYATSNRVGATVHKKLKSDEPLKGQLEGLKLPYCLAINVMVSGSPAAKQFVADQDFI